ncbi:MAG: cell division protein FtsH [Omnitrophica WOR_2 bacterium RIFCSPHIGHO2_01_FULL_48_9]|nr:MAG: cell division protein FtsH [Omnitrophica WOR_2 bacterium RIFCSPHIGHO2_02_FULL_48_11]OGX30056.1 MAG: cell division protein FtsH [Omnitrophica WOR_2 bacterium RIFCSPHIGHO2_01_FULL_48_9]
MADPTRKQLKGLSSRRPNRQPNNNSSWLFWIAMSLIFLILMSQTSTVNKISTPKQLTYSEFYSILLKNPETDQIEKLELVEGPENILKGTLKDGSEFRVNIPQKDDPILDKIRSNVNNFSVTPPQTFWSQLFFSFMPIVLIITFIWYISYRGSQVGNRIWTFGKSRAQMSNKDNNKLTFNDVAGVDEAKEELQEVIEFLKEPKKFQRLGGKIPKGVLLIGPPGTGKTLLARAVAGEAGVPFLSLSGSDFVEMFVGVGASRVRDLFEQARKASRTSGKGSIIFIDEIDAVGRLRFAGIGGGNDEREQTLNALLVEMDGFNTQTGVIIIAATNRPDTLDPALLRPGRFDRQIVVGLPDIKGREGILKVHTKNIKLAEGVDLIKIAQQTVYFSGADLANVCNEAALLAARNNKESVGMVELLAAVERVTMGPEKKSNTISKKEKEMTAYHEAGHALLSLLLDEVDRFTKVSIIPRGMAGGYTLTPPTEDKHYHNKKELLGTMTVLLGGLVAEEIFTGDTSTGVANDLQKVTRIARAMVCQFGMNEKLGRLSFGQQNSPHFLGRDLWEQKDYSEETAKNIDKEVQHLVNECYQRAQKLLSENHDKLSLLAKRLIEKEVIDIEEALVLLGMPDKQAAAKSEEPAGPKAAPQASGQSRETTDV